MIVCPIAIPGMSSSGPLPALASGLQVNIGHIGVDDATLQFIQRQKLALDGSFMEVSSVIKTMTEAFDNGWVDADWELVDPLPAHTTRYRESFCAEPVQITGGAPETNIAMKATWSGGAAVTGINGTGVSGLSVNLGARTATFTLSAITNASLDFTFADSGSTTAGPPRNIKIFKAAHETALNNGAIFDPDWLADVMRWRVLRTMDWQRTNASNAVAFTDLPTESYHFWGTTENITSGQKAGLPATVLAKLAAQSGKSVWVCIPHQFTNAAVLAFAQAMRDNTGVEIYVEYSNEMWNTFAQGTYAAAQAVTLFGGDRNMWYGYRAAQIMDIFRGAYGSDSGGGRWTGILSAQAANTAMYSAAILPGVDYYIAHEAANPSMPITKLFTHGAVAPYFGGYAGHAYTAFPSAAVTIDASTDRFTILNEHGWGGNEAVTLTTAGTLPAGLSTSTPYFIKYVSATVFQLSLTAGGAAVNFTTTGTGTSYIRREPGATLSDWADVSQAYFNQQLYDLLKPSAPAISDPFYSLAQLRSDVLVHKGILAARGMGITWYEGGSTQVNTFPLRDDNASGTLYGEVMATKVNLAVSNFADSQQAADLHAAQIRQFIADGGVFASKFTDTTVHSKYGPWGAKRWFSDTTNPVWVALTT